MMKVLPPDEAKRRARANVAAWKRDKALKRLSRRGEADGPIDEPDMGPQDPLNQALFSAASEGDTERARELIREGAEVDARSEMGWTALMLACDRGHLKTAQLLIEEGADIDARDPLGMTALMWAASKNMFGTARLLIGSGADINARNNEGHTALGLAYRHGASGISEELFSRGATE